MQKKTKPQVTHASDWENNLKKQQRMDLMKKIALWGGIILVCIVGLALLVKLAGTSGPPSPTDTPTVNEKVKDVSTTNDIIMGNPKAKVTIIEYADFQCPACASFNPVVNQILSTYPADVRVVYRFFPLTSLHKNAIIAGRAGYAAWKLGKFHEMKDELFSNQTTWEGIKDPRDEFIKYAKSIGLDEAKFTDLMNSKEAENALKTGEAEAISIGLNATPTFFIGKKQVSVNGFEDFKKLIDQELSGTTTTAPLQ